MRRDLLAWTVLILLAAALCTGCSGVPAPLATPDEPAVGQPQRDETAELTATVGREPGTEVNVTNTPIPGATQPELSEGARAVVARAREDLAQRTGLLLDAIRLVSVESVNDPDARLGCTQPDGLYVQVVTPGFRVMLRATAQVYTYLAGQNGRLVLCQEKAPPDSPSSPDPVDPSLKTLVSQAKEDLARRLSLPAAQIEVIEARSVVWPDGSLGCPDPEMAYTQVPVDGVLIRLRAGERVFHYHGGGGTAPFWCRRSTRP